MFRDLVIYTPMYVTFFWAMLLLASSGKRNKAKFFLGIFMFTAFLLYLSHAVFFHETQPAYILFDSVYTFASLSVYPLYFWYIKLLTREVDYNWKNIRILVPAIIFSLISATLFLLMSAQEKEIYLNEFLIHKNTGFSDKFMLKAQEANWIASRIVFAFQVIYFLILGRRLVIQYNKRIAEFYSNLESRTIVWVKLLLYSFVITSLMSLVFNILGRSLFMDSFVLLLVPSLVFSILLFLIGLQAYMQNHTVADMQADENQDFNLNLKEYNQTQLGNKLRELFTDKKIYRNSDLKITQVSAKLHTNRTYISQLINNEFNCSFSEFVNEYRIIEAKSLLADPKNQNFSLDYISELVGFGSLNTFIRVFKESEGITPGRFRDQNLFS